jgi:hypothetical protein
MSCDIKVFEPYYPKNDAIQSARVGLTLENGRPNDFMNGDTISKFVLRMGPCHINLTLLATQIGYFYTLLIGLALFKAPLPYPYSSHSARYTENYTGNQLHNRNESFLK